jgi:hypothetical protein
MVSVYDVISPSLNFKASICSSSTNELCLHTRTAAMGGAREGVSRERDELNVTLLYVTTLFVTPLYSRPATQPIGGIVSERRG